MEGPGWVVWGRARNDGSQNVTIDAVWTPKDGAGFGYLGLFVQPKHESFELAFATRLMKHEVR